MVSMAWIKWKIHQEWEESLPDRFDPRRAKLDADADRMTRNYENSYSMHHKGVEATPEEVKDLLDRYRRAEQGLIRWDQESESLIELDKPAADGGT